jgi:hypothetical protein
LCQKLRGHFGYYGITGNYEALARFWWEVRRTWSKWLGRRSQRGRMSWEDFERLLVRYPLPPPEWYTASTAPREAREKHLKVAVAKAIEGGKK